MDTSFENKDRNDEWLTPPGIIKALGNFDLDPCSPINRPWSTALNHFTVEDDGLPREWTGRVWCNPPYGKETGKWIEKLSEHGSGIALIFARTETRVWHDYIWNKAHSVFFFRGRLSFYTVEGIKGGTAGAPSALISYSEEDTQAIKYSGLTGKLIII